MRIIKRVFIAITATAAALSLTGCGGGIFDSHTDPTVPEDFEQREAVPPKLFINEETGHITKQTDEYGSTVYENFETHSPDDLVIETDWWGTSMVVTNDIMLTGEIILDGKPYEGVAPISWYTEDDGIDFYNMYLASPDVERIDLLKSTPIDYMSYEYAHDQIEAYIADGKVPKLEFQVHGKVLTETDPDVAAAKAKDVPAWKAYQDLIGDTDGKEKFDYSYFCRTYQLESNQLAIISALEELFAGSGLQFMDSTPYSQPTTDVTVETAEPCDITYEEDPSADDVWNEEDNEG